MKCAFLFTCLLFTALTVSPSAQAQSADALAGMQAYNSGDYASAYRLLRAAADANDPEAQVNLGYMYARGQGVVENQLEAFRLYKKSADLGDGEGMNALGYKYLAGTGVAMDPSRAIHWFCAAIAMGNPRAMNNLALMLNQGEYVTEDPAEARSLWEQASLFGHSNAMMNLALSYMTSAPLDDAAGRRWLLAAAQRGQPRAIQLLQAQGYSGSLPAPFDETAMMVPFVKNPPGRAKICSLIS